MVTPSPTHVFDVSLFKIFFCFVYCGAQQKIYEIYSAKASDNTAILPSRLPMLISRFHPARKF